MERNMTRVSPGTFSNLRVAHSSAPTKKMLRIARNYPRHKLFFPTSTRARETPRPRGLPYLRRNKWNRRANGQSTGVNQAEYLASSCGVEKEHQERTAQFTVFLWGAICTSCSQ